MRVATRILAGLAFSVLASSPLAQQAEAKQVAQRVDAVLQAKAGPEDGLDVAEQLARLGMPALEPLFERLQDDSLSGGARQDAMLRAIGLLPREGVLAFLSTLVRPGTSAHVRLTALDLVARFGARSELRLAVDLAVPLGLASPPPTALQEALVRAFVAISARESGALRDLVAFFGRVEPAVQTAIVAALRRGEGREVPSRLAGLLGRANDAVDALLLFELAESARQAPSEDLLVFERVRGYMGHPNKGLAVLACNAADLLVDDGAVPDLIILLCEGDANVRRAAHVALGNLTELNLAPEPDVWMSWLDVSLAWWEERADACRADLVSGTATAAASAIQEVARQRLFIREVVQMLALALQRDEQDLVQSACRALAGVPRSAARAALHTLASRPDSETTRSARIALSRRSSQRAPSRAIALPRTKTILP